MFFKNQGLKDGWDMFTIASNGFTPKVYRNSKELTLVSDITTGTYSKMIVRPSNLRISQTGIIDEVGFWKRQMSLSEIQTLYKNGYGLFYDDFNVDFTNFLANYFKLNNNFIDAVDGIVKGSTYVGSFRVGKQGNGIYIDGTNPVLVLGQNNSTLSWCDAIGDIPFTFNFWVYKPNLASVNSGISKGRGTYSIVYYEYYFYYTPTQFILTLYSLGSSTNYRTLTYNL